MQIVVPLCKIYFSLLLLSLIWDILFVDVSNHVTNVLIRFWTMLMMWLDYTLYFIIWELLHKISFICIYIFKSSKLYGKSWFVIDLRKHISRLNYDSCLSLLLFSTDIEYHSRNDNIITIHIYLHHHCRAFLSAS